LSITETVLVFVGIPALVVLVVYALVYASTARRGSKRYRPGRPFTFAPVWFLASTDGSGTDRPALGAGEQRPALPGPILAQAADHRGGSPGEAPGAGMVTGADAATAAHGVTGGASDSW
jgi:hypothetical protein